MVHAKANFFMLSQAAIELKKIVAKTALLLLASLLANVIAACDAGGFLSAKTVRCIDSKRIVYSTDTFLPFTR